MRPARIQVPRESHAGCAGPESDRNQDQPDSEDGHSAKRESLSFSRHRVQHQLEGQEAGESLSQALRSVGTALPHAQAHRRKRLGRALPYHSSVESDCHQVEGRCAARRGSTSALPLLIALWVGLASLLAAQPEDIESWNTARSASFQVHSNASPERAAEIVASLERFRAAFAGLAPELELSSPAPFRIFAFRDADSYSPYKTGGEGRGVSILGQFLSHPDSNYITLNADPAYLGSFAVVFHEYVHFLVQSNFPGVPRWFNEGLAEYYSTFFSDRERAYVGQPVDRHVRWLRVNRELGLEEVLRVTRETAVGHDAHGAGRFYAVSWILVHYLLSDSSDLSDSLAGYFEAVRQGNDPHGAFIDSFGVRPAELEDAIREYVAAGALPIASLSLDGLPGVGDVAVVPAQPARVLTGLADLLAHMGREEEAARHALDALAYDPESGDAYAVLAYARDRQQRLREAHELWREAEKRVPAEAGSYLLHGRHLMALAEGGGLPGDGTDVASLADDARRSLAVAAEIDPSYGEAWALLGVSHLLPGGRPGEGIGHLERATSLLPGRADLLLHLVQLYVREGRDQEALGVIESDLRQVGSDEMIAAAEEEVARWRLIRSANAAMTEGDLETAIALFDQAISLTSDPDLRTRMEESLHRMRLAQEEDRSR